ncbi:type II secretion system protein GspM [Variovorax sp. UMC13]|uniref:type II secretion system protein GspM n=1 Tax=Variovorax sp. UMC13 TaxID=1862326 RepID=UPI0015FF15E3|nr:type II secretion system protein GspM [Variovorax sp. UMC13]MBB1604535.1 general secretion pathway protein GspM [Variovorax sp. UMC13]
MSPWIDKLQARWDAWWPSLALREQRLVQGMVALLLLALLWWVGLAPALRTLATAPAAHAELDAQLQRMSALQIQAKALQSQPRASRDEALRAIESSVQQSLGSNAQIQVAGSGEGVLVTLRGTSADGLAQWLAQARGNARAVPREVHLTRSQAGAAPAPRGATAAPAPTDALVRWDGTLVMNLPAK